MRIVDEYVALRVLVGDWPPEIPQDLLGLTYTRHWRLLSALAVPTRGRVSQRMAALSSNDREVIRQPHPDLVEVLDPRATTVLAADLLQTIGPTSLLIVETLAAAIDHRSAIFVGDPQNATGAIARHAETLGVTITGVPPPG